MSEKLYLDEDFRMLAKTYPADVSAIGVTTLIDYVEAVEAELARLTAELAELREQVRWIPVSERLPEVEDGYCITVIAVDMNTEKPRPFLPHYDKQGGFEYLNATHWIDFHKFMQGLPLPPLPEDTDADN